MKQYLGIFFLSVYLISFAEFHQLLRIPFLVQHFQQHQGMDPKLSFTDFLKMHYLGPVEITDDFQQDQQLPFRNTSCHTGGNFSICSLQMVTFSLKEPETPEAEYFNFNETSSSLCSAFDIFQPPRCA